MDWETLYKARVGLRYGTAYDGLEADPTMCKTVVRALAEGNTMRATARIVQVDQDMVWPRRHWVVCHCRTVRLNFWHSRPVNACRPPDLAGLY